MRASQGDSLHFPDPVNPCSVAHGVQADARPSMGRYHEYICTDRSQHVPRPCRLRLEHARYSPFVSRVSVTLVTAYDVSRLHMLDGLCGSWGGHLSAAIYQVLVKTQQKQNRWSKVRLLSSKFDVRASFINIKVSNYIRLQSYKPEAIAATPPKFVGTCARPWQPTDTTVSVCSLPCMCREARVVSNPLLSNQCCAWRQFRV